MRILTLTRIFFLGFVLFLAWASLFQLDQSIKAQGQLMPETRTQVIQAADGGVLEKLAVSEGDVVKAGQVLATLESERAMSGVEEGRAKVAALMAALARAQAEGSASALNFDPVVRKYPHFEQEQRGLYAQKLKGLQAELATLQEALELAKDEFAVNEKLFKTGDTSRLELMRAKRQVAELAGKIESTRNKYMQDARQEATKIQEELASQRFKLEERTSVLEHTQLTSPVDGVVKILKINTVGGVLRAGDELMQISPTDVGLMVEIKVMPADIGHLHVGLPVSIKLDAYDSAIYGSLFGQLEYISSDTLTEQGPNGQPLVYYRSRVKIDTSKANPKIKFDLLKPGMTASVDILTGSRSVLTYLLKPVMRAFMGAATER
jgi:membrane fusion protein, adhesin transport system